VTRSSLLLATALALAAASPALAQEAPPTQAQLAQAKKAFEDGNALYKAGKLPEAIDKLKESFRLSRNAFLLYNIGHIYDELGQKDVVLFYYKKFLTSAPANAPMRPNVEKRVTELEGEGIQPAKLEGDAAANTEATQTQPTSKYSKADFKHDPVFTTPPNVPVDITASVPQDSGFTVKLFYRPAGEAAFTAKPMTWRSMELVARIPASKVTAKNVQYYLEVRDAKNNLVTRAGKSTSPNLVQIEGNAQPHYYKDFVDEGGEVFVPVSTVQEPIAGEPGEQPETAGPSKFGTVKWIATGVAAGAIGTSIYSYLMAGKQHDALVSDANFCGAPPCQKFDAAYDRKVEQLGKRWELTYEITLGVGLVTAGVSAYFWYRDLKAKKHHAAAPSESGKGMLPGMVLAPIIGDHTAGAAAAVRF
jgi:tetratricopeptide (TPR) repeat protein